MSLAQQRIAPVQAKDYVGRVIDDRHAWLGWRIRSVGRICLIRSQENCSNVGDGFCDLGVHSSSLHVGHWPAFSLSLLLIPVASCVSLGCSYVCRLQRPPLRPRSATRPGLECSEQYCPPLIAGAAQGPPALVFALHLPLGRSAEMNALLQK
jgi:hypothetical protein